MEVRKSDPGSHGSFYRLILSPLTSMHAVRPPPTRLRISNRHYDKDNVTLTLEWDAPQGDAVVDYYTISISPPPLSYLTQVFTSSSNITLNSSIGEYNASIVAVNCNGESIPLQMGIDAREGKPDILSSRSAQS